MREQRKRETALRDKATHALYGARWRKARAMFLRANPLCITHGARGEVVPATVVDHIEPHKGDLALFWRQANWQALCKPCHDSKTAREDGGFGREREKRANASENDSAAARIQTF